MFPYKNIFIFPREWKIKQQKFAPPKKQKCVFVSMVIVPV